MWLFNHSKFPLVEKLGKTMHFLPKATKTHARKFLAACVICIFIAGCAHVDITKTGSGFYDATNANEVEILKTRPTRIYEELGIVTVTGFESSETAKMHNAIRAKAATLGANAVILTEEGMIPKGWGNYERWANGVAVRYKSDSK
ncbi:MAG: hypothetical protein KBA75_06890 [Alphaproteobacteria bacterium]|nr:hypothetical protein [Alphaproteobacteria bacterium]